MSTIREYTKKIKSFKNTQKITRTMKMVSASKLRKANSAQLSAKRYEEKLEALLLRLISQIDDSKHPVLHQRSGAVQSIHLIIFSSDRGLCGGYNNNLIKHIDSWIEENLQPGQTIRLSFCGRKGFQKLSKLYDMEEYFEDSTVKPSPDDAKTITNNILETFLNGKYDTVYFAYNLFNSPISQEPVVEQFLPLDPENLLEADLAFVDTIFEPTKEELLNRLLPQYLQFKVFYTLLENAAGEHGARMTAMDNATRNTSDLIDEYTLIRNRIRQAAITTELIEIISGAEALEN